MDISCNNSSDAGRAQPVDNLSRARGKLRAQGLFLGDLPRDHNDRMWTTLKKRPYLLSAPELMVLKVYILNPTMTDLSCGTEEFSKSTVSELQNCLDLVPDATLMEALITADTAFVKVLSTTAPNAENTMKAMIEDHKQKVVTLLDTVNGNEDHALAARLYTLKDPIALYWPMNKQLNSPMRSRELISNYVLYMRLLIQSLRTMGKNGKYFIANKAYRGLIIARDEGLQKKYDNYQTCFPPGKLLTMAAFTSVSLVKEIAESTEFSDKLVYELTEVTGVRMSHISQYPDEAELLLIPPCVFEIENVSKKDNDRLVVSLKHIRQPGASYLLDPDDHMDSDKSGSANGDDDGGNDEGSDDDEGDGADDGANNGVGHCDDDAGNHCNDKNSEGGNGSSDANRGADHSEDNNNGCDAEEEEEETFIHEADDLNEQDILHSFGLNGDVESELRDLALKVSKNYRCEESK
jgi:hypothetical protein